jgi:hypothetical protein
MQGFVEDPSRDRHHEPEPMPAHQIHERRERYRLGTRKKTVLNRRNNVVKQARHTRLLACLLAKQLLEIPRLRINP